MWFANLGLVVLTKMSSVQGVSEDISLKFQIHVVNIHKPIWNCIDIFAENKIEPIFQRPVFLVQMILWREKKMK